MKKIEFILLQINSLWKENKVIFSIFSMSSILCSITLFFCYGNMVSYMHVRDSQERYLREYKVYVEDDIETEALVEQLRQFESAYINEIFLVFQESDGELVYVSLEEKSHEELQNGYKPIFVSFMAEKVATKETHPLILETLQKQFPEHEIDHLFLFINADLKRMPTEVAIVVFMYSISILSFLFLMKYMIEHTYKDMIVCHIVGASHKDVVLFVMTEVLLLNMATTVIAILLHMGLYDCVFSKINLSEHVHYRASDYLLLFGINIAIVQLVHLPFIISLCRNSVMDLQRTYTGM